MIVIRDIFFVYVLWSLAEMSALLIGVVTVLCLVILGTWYYKKEGCEPHRDKCANSTPQEDKGASELNPYIYPFSAMGDLRRIPMTYSQTSPDHVPYE